MTLLHTFGLLGWLDAIMLRLVSSPPSVVGKHSATPTDLPFVLLIGSSLYETDFAQASPLRPDKVASIVKAIGAAKPASLVIDLDLSPGPAELQQPDRSALDEALGELARSGTKVVLPVPQRVATPSLQQIKFDWMRRMCGQSNQGALRFALASITTHQGVVTQYDANLASIGKVAAESGDALSACMRVMESSERWKGPLLSTAFSDSSLLPAEPKKRLRPFNLRLVADADTHIFNVSSSGKLPLDGSELTGRTVFLGGAYDTRDQFITVMDELGQRTEGVVVHAITYDSLQHPANRVSNLFAFALDVVLGVGLGYLFSLTWGWHTDLRSRADLKQEWAAQIAPRISLALNLILVAVLVAITVVLAHAVFYPVNWWVNPGPIVLGVFAKFLLASRSAPLATSSAPAAGLVAKRLGQVDSVFLFLLVAAALASFLLDH